MSHGLALYSAAGTLIYSTVDITWNQVDYFTVAGGSSVSKNYTDVLPPGMTLAVQICFVDDIPSSTTAIAHTVDINGYSLYVSGGNQTTAVLVLAQ